MNLTPKPLSNQAFFGELKARPGLMPVAIDACGKKIVWADMEAYHFYEGFFHRSLNTWASLKGDKIVSFTTGFDVLENDAVVTNSVPPGGFIFHAARCGSTLLAKTLARSRENLVISEAAPLNQIWQVFTNNWKNKPEINEQNIRIYRNLVLAMARKRLPSHQQLFIKFTSVNIQFFNFIHAAFPAVPAIFLTRNRQDILSSFQKRLPGWLNEQNAEMLKMLTGSTNPDAESVIDELVKRGIEQPPAILKSIDYSTLTPGNLPAILNCLNVQYNEAQLALMKTQFAFDSKTEFNRKPFKK
jgi:hypothetical protein